MRIPLDAVTRLGKDLARCEGVMCARDGTVWAADGRGACTRIAPDGSHEERVGQVGGDPNGICLDAEGRVVIANLHGEVQRLAPTAVTRCSTEASGRKTSPFPFMDRRGRLGFLNSRPGST
jgi:sugar lactone lactonase YvrE